MVSRTPRSVGVTTGISASKAKSACSAKRQNSASKSRSSTTSRLGIVKQSLRDKQFSSEVAEHVSKARRDSTVKVYDAKWQIFRDWANERKIDPIQATPQIVADFLTFLFSVKKCQVSTIRGYRSTISNTLKFRTGYDFWVAPGSLGTDKVFCETETSRSVSGSQMGLSLCFFAYVQGSI